MGTRWVLLSFSGDSRQMTHYRAATQRQDLLHVIDAHCPSKPTLHACLHTPATSGPISQRPIRNASHAPLCGSHVHAPRCTPPCMRRPLRRTAHTACVCNAATCGQRIPPASPAPPFPCSNHPHPRRPSPRAPQALHLAAYLGRDAMVKELVRRGADPNKQDKVGVQVAGWSRVWRGGRVLKQ